MRTYPWLIPALVLAAAPAWAGGSFTGTYTSTGEQGTTTLSLEQRGTNVTGTLRDHTGTTMNVDAQIRGGAAVGTAKLAERSIPLRCERTDDGLTLTLTLGQTEKRIPFEVWRPAKVQVRNPLAPEPKDVAADADNPLAAPSAKSPWLGTYVKADGSVKLIVSQDEGGKLAAVLEVLRKGTPSRFPVTFDRTDTELRGSFASGTKSFPLSLVKRGAGYILTSVSHEHALRKTSEKPVRASVAAEPDPLPGAAGGPTVLFRDPTKTYTARLPKGWRATKVAGGNHQVMPDVPGAYVLLLLGTVDREDRGKAPVRILREDNEMLVEFAQGNLNVESEEDEASFRAFTGMHPGAYAEWPGSVETPNGDDADLTVVNGFVHREHTLVMVLATVLKGKEAQFVPQIKQLLSSIQILRVPTYGEMDTIHQNDQGTNPLPPQQQRQTFSRQVSFNNQRLDDATIQALEQGMRIRIPDGRYWYDKTLGAIGYWGGPTFAFFPPNLNLGGPIQPGCSGGGTGTYINGRELHPQDVAGLRAYIGRVDRGNFWMLPNGTFGYVGGPAIANLFVLAQQHANRGAGGGGGGSGAWTRYSNKYGGRGTHFGSFGDGTFYFSDGKTSWSN